MGGVVAEIETTKGLGINPFKGKSFNEIDELLRLKGFTTKGPDPVSGKGSYFHPHSGRKYFLDKGKSRYTGGMKENPHVDVHHLSREVSSEFWKRKYPLGDKLYESQ